MGIWYLDGRQTGGDGSCEVEGPVAYADLDDGSSSPSYTDSGVTVYQDENTEGNVWVPQFTEGLTLASSLHADTYTPSSPPDGWVEHIGGVGSITVAGGYICLSATINSVTGLRYTLDPLGANDTVVVIFSGYGLSDGDDTSNYTDIELYDDRVASRAILRLEQQAGTGNLEWFANAAGVAGEDPYASEETAMLIWRNSSNSRSEVKTLSRAEEPNLVAESVVWQGYGTTDDQIYFNSRQHVGSGTGYLYVKFIAIYRGEM